VPQEDEQVVREPPTVHQVDPDSGAALLDSDGNPVPFIRRLWKAKPVLLLGDSMIKFWYPDNPLIHSESFSGSSYDYVAGVIAGDLLRVRNYPYIFTLLGANQVRSYWTVQEFANSIHDFLDSVFEKQTYAHVFLGTIVPQPKASKVKTSKIKSFNRVLAEVQREYRVKGYNVFWCPVHTCFLDKGKLKPIDVWFQEDQFHVTSYALLEMRDKLIEETALQGVPLVPKGLKPEPKEVSLEEGPFVLPPAHGIDVQVLTDETDLPGIHPDPKLLAEYRQIILDNPLT
jgi:hypothetical protein